MKLKLKNLMIPALRILTRYKNADINKLTSLLKPKGVNIPQGFIVSVCAYQYFIIKNQLLHAAKVVDGIGRYLTA